MSEPSIDLIEQVPLAFQRLQESDVVFYSPSIAGEIYTGPEETRDARVAIAALTNLINALVRSSDAANLAMSWRNYNVGSTAIMANHDTGNMGYLSGYNVKPYEGESDINIHAEQMAISKGRSNGLNRVVGISVFADPTNQDANPLERPTLAPCPRCVDMFVGIPEVHDNTLVLGSNLDNTVCEFYTVGYLIGSETVKLAESAFSLQTEADLEYYDRNTKIQAVNRIFELYKVKPDAH